MRRAAELRGPSEPSAICNCDTCKGDDGDRTRAQNARIAVRARSVIDSELEGLRSSGKTKLEFCFSGAT